MNKAAHILVFPYPAQGHMIPLLDFTYQLITLHQNLTVTILVTPKNLPLLNATTITKNPSSSSSSSISTLVLPFPSHPSIPHGIENVKELPNSNSSKSFMSALSHLHRPLRQWFESHQSPPVAIISDMFLGWTNTLAVELGIRRIVFSPSGAFALSIMYSLWRYLPKRQDPNDQNEVVSFPNILNCPHYPWWQLSPLYRTYVEGDSESDSEVIASGFRQNIASWGLVVNSFNVLELEYFEHLKKELGHDRVWAVGPLLPPQGRLLERGGPSSVPVEFISSWLDDRNQTVLYICFGSQAMLRNDQMEAIALALERSGVHFIWSVTEPTKEHVAGYGEIPSWFEQRVNGRGLVLRGWAPQVMILRHRVVGVFLTHCGWNSILEGLTSGVTMLAWPMGADQFSDATLLVDQLKVGRRVCEGGENVPDSDELAELIVESVSDNRKRVKELREAAVKAVKEGGSSVKDLESFISHLSAA